MRNIFVRKNHKNIRHLRIVMKHFYKCFLSNVYLGKEDEAKFYLTRYTEILNDIDDIKYRNSLEGGFWIPEKINKAEEIFNNRFKYQEYDL